MTIDWFITNRCNRYGKCRFCNAPGSTFPADAPVENALSICDAIAEHHIEMVTLCGGEPLLYNGIEQVVGRLASRGVRMVLYTNGVSNPALMFDLLPYISILSLPLDTLRASNADAMRGYDQVQGVLEILRVLPAVQNPPIVKLGTVITKQNIDGLQDLAAFVKRTPCIKVWRVYQYSPGGIGACNASEFSVSDAEFQMCVRDIESQFVSSHCTVSTRTVEDNVGYCMIMDSHGQFYRYDGAYHPLPVTIRESNERIAKEYDIDKYKKQKGWHKITS